MKLGAGTIYILAFLVCFSSVSSLSDHEYYVDCGYQNDTNNGMYNSSWYGDLNYSGDITDDLVSHWRFENNAYDVYGGYDGTEQGDGVSYVNSQLDRGIEFAGSNDYVNLSNFLSAETELTITAWAYFDSFTSTPAIFETLSGTDRFSAYVRTTGQIDGIGGGAGEYALPDTGGATLSTGQWYHLAWVFLNGSYLKAYINGSYDKNATGDSTPVNGGSQITIGIRNGLTQDLDGRVDDLRIYRKALSDSDISTLYAVTSTTLRTFFTLQNNDISISRINGTVYSSNILDSSSQNINNTALGNLETYLRLDGDFTDSYKSNDFTNSGVTFADGIYTQSGFFNVTESDYIYHASLWDTTPDDLSISFWFKPRITFNSTISSDQFLVLKENIVDEDKILVKLESSDGKLYFQSETNDSGANTISSTTTNWNSDTWYHIVIIWSITATRGKELWINNVKEASATGENVLMLDGTGTNFHIGSSRVPSLYYDGYIDDFRAYNTDISIEMIDCIYNNRTVSFVSNGFWNVTVEHDVRIKKVLINGTETYEMLLSGVNIIEGCDMEGFFLLAPELQLLNSTNIIQDANNDIYVSIGDIQVDSTTSNFELRFNNSIDGANLSISLTESESELTISPSSNSTSTHMNWSIQVVPAIYYDATQTLTISAISNDGSESSFSIYVTFMSSTPILSILINNGNESYSENATSTSVSGVWAGGGGNIYDGNWSTYDEAAAPINHAYLWINYSKPINALPSSVWQVKDGSGTYNLSIPLACWDLNPLQFYISSSDHITDSVSYRCYDGTSWIILNVTYNEKKFYEEGMHWNIGENISSYDFGDVQVESINEYVVYLGETTGINNITLNNWTTNQTDFYTESPISIFIYSGGVATLNISLNFTPSSYYDNSEIGCITLNDTSNIYGGINSDYIYLLGKSSTPQLGVNLTYYYGHCLLDIEYNVTITFEKLDSGSNNLTIDNWTSNHSYYYSEFPLSIYLPATQGATNTTYIFFNTSSYLDSNLTGLITWNSTVLGNLYGLIDVNTTILTAYSLTPTLANVVYSYNNSSNQAHLPQDNVSYFFEANNTNLNTVQIKSYTWTLDNDVKQLNSNFSTMISSQNSYNSTYAIIELVREIEDFVNIHQSVVLIQFFGIGSESGTNVFNLSVYPNFSMVDLQYMYNIYTPFLDKTINTKYSGSDFKVWNEGSYTYNITTRSDTYSGDFSDETWSYLTSTNTYHDVNPNKYYKLEYNNPGAYHHALFWINVSASASTTLKISVNGNSHSLSIGTCWDVKSVYTDDLISGTNTLIFELYGNVGVHIYIGNTISNVNLTLYESDATFNYVEMTDSCVAIDVLFCDFILDYEIYKYPGDTQLQVTNGTSNTWSYVYYPSVNTDSTFLRVNFILESPSGRYLDNFTAVFEFECPLYVLITSNLSSLTFYRNEGEQSFTVKFDNDGNRNTTITLFDSSLSWIDVSGYNQTELLVGDYITCEFSTNPTTSLLGSVYSFTLTLTGTNNMTYSETVSVYLESRPSVSISDTLFSFERDDKDDDHEFSVTITNNGPGIAYISITWSTSSKLIPARLTVANGSEQFELASGESKIVWFTVSGGANDQIDRFSIYVKTYLTDSRVSVYTTDTISVESDTGGDRLSANFIWLLIAIAISLFFVGGFLRRGKKEDRNHERHARHYRPGDDNVHSNITKYDNHVNAISTRHKFLKNLGMGIFAIGIVVIICAMALVMNGYAHSPFGNPLNDFWGNLKNGKLR